MSSHAKLSTSSRVLTALALLLTVSFAVAMIPSTSDAKRPKKETTSPKIEPVFGDSSAIHDTTLPGPSDSIAVDTMPEMIYQQPPVYPREAKMSGQTGTVWVRALVDKTGKVRAVAIQKSSGHKSLDNATMVAAWENRFIPAKKDGQPVAVWITYNVDFKLTEGR